MESGLARAGLHAHVHQDASTGRPTEKLVAKVDEFVTRVAERHLNDKNAIHVERLIKIKDQLSAVVEAYESRSEFSIKEQMSARKRELDRLIETAEEDYAERKRQHDAELALIDNQLLENHRHLMEIQQQSMVKELKNMNEYLFYHNQIIQQISDIDASLEALSCCSRWCCLFPSKEIAQKQQQLARLQAEQDAFASEDHTIVSQILMKKMQASREALLQKQAELVMNQPKETVQLLLDERAKLQASIDAEREAYYDTISPAVMLNLVRLQSFLKRAQISLKEAKSSAQTTGDAARVGLIDAMLVLVGKFLGKFHKMCADFVCRPPNNPENKISYAQYCDRFHRLEEKQKQRLIKGLPEPDDARYGAIKQELHLLNEVVFHEHVEEVPQPELTALSSPMLQM